MVVATAALMVFLMLMMVMAAAALMVLLMLMVVATAALMVLVMVMMMTAAALMVFLMIMMVTTAALMMLLMLMVVAAAAGFPMFVVVMVLPLPAGCMGRIPGVDHHIRLNGPGNADQLGDQGVRISGGEPQLLGGEGDVGLLHLGVGIELCLDLGGTVGAVQIFDDVYLPGHREPSFDFDI